MRKLLFPISICCLVFLTTACAPPMKDRFFWPPPPQQPQVEFIGVYSKTADLVTGFAKTLQDFSGESGKDAVFQPTAVVADGHGKVYVSDTTLNRIVEFDFVKGHAGDFISQGIERPFGLDIDSKGNLYVVERGSAEVSVFTPEGALLYTFGKGELSEPMRITVDEVHGRLYVSDREDHQVKVFTSDGQFLQSIGGTKGLRSGLDGQFNAPNDLEVDRDGNLYVCDQLNARIQIFDQNGAFLRKFGTRGDQIHNFEAPMGIAIDNSGRLWIVDIRKGALLTYSNTADPQFLFATLGPNETPGQYNLRSPMDVYIDKNNRIYVADGLLHRISVWQVLDDPYLSQHPLPTNWLQRTDVLDRWYRESGATPPKNTPTEASKP